MGVGVSTLLYEMIPFVPLATADPAKNPHLVVINGGEAQANASDFATLSSPFWGTLLNYLVPNTGVTINRLWPSCSKTSIRSRPAPIPLPDVATLQTEFETVAQNMLVNFPNVKLMYFASRMYSGYSGTVDLADPEPYAYEAGFAMRGAILDQINGAPNLNYKPANGAVLAPWMSWGPYTWANGLIARSDGLTYSCQDVRSDGRHPSVLYGAPKVAGEFLNFLKTADSTAPWFLASPPAAR